ncbi:hypothetical protein RUND412_005623 [Rhizina undulata]
MAFNFPDPQSLTLHDRISFLCSCIRAVDARIKTFEEEAREVRLADQFHTTWSQAVALITDGALIQEDIVDILDYALGAHADCLFYFSMTIQMLGTNPHLSPLTRAVMVKEATANIDLLETHVLSWAFMRIIYTKIWMRDVVVEAVARVQI